MEWPGQDHNQSPPTDLGELKELLTLVLQHQQQILAALEHPQPSSSVATLPRTQTQGSPLHQPPSPELDLTPLQDYLDQGQWYQADQETARLLLLACDRLKAGFLREEDLSKLSGDLLRQIDQLWLRASGGKFGLSVQLQLYQGLGGTNFFHGPLWQEFSQMVGWSTLEQWAQYDELDFSPTAPPGHLPVMGDGQIWFVGGWHGSHRGFRLLMAHCRRHGL